MSVRFPNAGLLALAALTLGSDIEQYPTAKPLPAFHPTRERAWRPARRRGQAKTPARDAWARAIAKKRAQKQARKRQRRAR